MILALRAYHLGRPRLCLDISAICAISMYSSHAWTLCSGSKARARRREDSMLREGKRATAMVTVVLAELEVEAAVLLAPSRL